MGALAIGVGSFWLLALGCVLVGLSSAFGQLYRFAAAEAVTEAERSRAISVVLAGGLVAGFVGPQLARLTADLSEIPYRRVLPRRAVARPRHDALPGRASSSGGICGAGGGTGASPLGHRAATDLPRGGRQPVDRLRGDEPAHDRHPARDDRVPRARARGRGVRDPVAHGRHVPPGILHRRADPANRRAGDDPAGYRDQRGEPGRRLHGRRGLALLVRPDAPRGRAGTSCSSADRRS